MLNTLVADETVKNETKTSTMRKKSSHNIENVI